MMVQVPGTPRQVPDTPNQVPDTWMREGIHRMAQYAPIPRWSSITREERFFTCVLYHDLAADPAPAWAILRDRLRCPADTTVVDVGDEVCFFRDAWKERLIERQRDLEKQTFDLVFTLSNRALVLVEAKAQQGFRTKQMAMLDRARKVILSSAVWHSPEVYLVALCSALYTPGRETRRHFDAFVRWNEMARAYRRNGEVYTRANEIYGR